MLNKVSLRDGLLVAAVACAGVGADIAAVQAAAVDVSKFPTKPIRFIAPFVAGGGTDITARAVAAKLTERWGQQVVVDNRSGAAGAIRVELTATAAPDGYTICLISASHSVNSATNPKLPYDLTRDLQAISQATSLFYIMYVHPSVPAKSVAELITYEVDQWYGIITSAKVPRPLVDKLAVAIAEAVKSPETAKRLSGEGSQPVGSTPDQFSAHIRGEIAKWRKLAKDAALVLH